MTGCTTDDILRGMRYGIIYLVSIYRPSQPASRATCVTSYSILRLVSSGGLKTASISCVALSDPKHNTRSTVPHAAWYWIHN